jgi:hypothetical protein
MGVSVFRIVSDNLNELQEEILACFINIDKIIVYKLGE